MADEGTNQAGGPPQGAAEILEEIGALRGKLVELEEKLSKLCVTQEEWKAYRKVASILAGQGGVPGSGCDDEGKQCIGQPGCGPQHCYVLIPMSTAPLHAVVGPMIFTRGFKGLGF